MPDGLGGQEHYTRLRELPFYATSGIYAAEGREVHIHEDDIGGAPAGLLNSLPAISCLSHHLDIIFQGQELMQTFPHGLAIINDQYPHPLHLSPPW